MKGKRIIYLVITIILLSSCSHTYSPGRVPQIELDVVQQYQEKLSVDLINDQPITTPALFAAVGFGHKYYANYNEWTQFFVDDFAKELTKRGVNVSKNSPNKLKVRLGNFAYFLVGGGFAYRVNMTVVLTSGDGKWSKTYEETDTSGLSIGRAFGSVIYHTIEKMLKDPEVINKMKITAS